MASPKPAPWAPVSLADAWEEALAETAPGHLRALQALHQPLPLTQYQHDPEGFLVDVLGIDRATIVWSLNAGYASHTWDGTQDPMTTAMRCIAEGQWCAVSSGTGTGKTFLMAALLLWYIACWTDAIAVTVATKEDQMAKGVWREIARHWPAFSSRFPQAELTHLRIRMDPARGDAWGAWGVTSKVTAGASSASGVQGLHAPRLLILVDEAPGVEPAVMTALINTATDEANVIAVFGNPDHQADPLATFSRMKRVAAIRVSGLDHPNVVTGTAIVPGAVSRGSIQMRADEYGVDSPLYGSRVRGIAPAEAENALVKRAWVQAAFDRYEAWSAQAAVAKWPVAYGVDPSNSDAGDLAAVARFEGPLCTGVEASRCPDANVLGTRVWLHAKSEGVPPDHIGVDSVGVGAGTANEINRLAPSHCARLNGGAAPIARVAKGAENSGWQSDANQFLNLRAQMYWQAREDLRQGRVGVKPDAELMEELVAPTYEVRAGKVVIEPKDDIRARLGHSPNKADAFVYANWVRPRTIPLPVETRDGDEQHLGWKKAGGKLRAKTGQDVLKERHPNLGRKTDGKYWNW